MIKETKKMLKRAVKKLTGAAKNNERISEAVEKRIQSIMKKTGWTRRETIKNVKEAKGRLGITYADYDRYNFHSIPVEEQKARYNEILEERAQRRKEKKGRIKRIVKATGWTPEKAEAEMMAAEKERGISNADFMKYKLYEVPADEQKNRMAKRLEEKRQKALAEKEHYIECTMKATGWDRETTVEKITEAQKRTGCLYEEYFICKFYTMTPEQQEQFYLVCHSKMMRDKYDVNKQFNYTINNKEKTNQYFDKFLKRPWCVNTKVSLEEFAEKFKNSTKILYKPVRGSCGKGVEAFELNGENTKEVYEKLATYPKGIVEEYVVQHPVMSTLSPSSVNTIRIVTISSKTKPVTADGKYMDVAYAALRIGGGKSIVDNFHSGGMVAAVDIETGEVVTDAADMGGNVFAVHPVTGAKIKGFKIPLFEQAIKLVTDACAMDLVEGNLGWDIAMTENGPVIIEVNTGPAVALLTVPYVAEKKGTLPVMAKYL